MSELSLKSQIKELFSLLTRTDQLELLRELNAELINENPVSRLNELCQVQYGQNISFEVNNVGTQQEPLINVKLLTPWGNFEDNARNQKIAKARTAEMAIESLYTQLGIKKLKQ